MVETRRYGRVSALSQENVPLWNILTSASSAMVAAFAGIGIGLKVREQDLVTIYARLQRIEDKLDRMIEREIENR